MKIVFIVDRVSESDIRNERLKPDGRTVRLIRYIGESVKKVYPDVQYTLLVAAPGIGKATAKEYKEHAPEVQKSINEYNPDYIVSLGKSSIYAVTPYLPDDFPKTLEFKKLWGRVSSGVPRVIFGPSTSMVWAGKTEDGGYLYLRTLVESVIGGLRDIPQTEAKYTLVTTQPELAAIMGGLIAKATGVGNKLLRDLRASGKATPLYMGVDTETTGLNVVTDKVRTIQISAEDHTGYTFPFDLVDPAQWEEYFRQLKDTGYVYVMQNGKFDYKMLSSNGVQMQSWVELSAAHVIVDEREGTHNLEFIAQQTLGEGKFDVDKEALTSGDIADTAKYGARDADLTRRALAVIHPSVKDRPIYSLLNRVAFTLARGEAYGVKIDRPRLMEMLSRVDKQLAEYQKMFESINLNPMSPKQVAKYLDAAKTDRRHLKDLNSEVADAIIEFRSLRKVRNSYLIRLEAASAADGRFHPDIRIAGPVTGRTSSGSGSVSEGYEFLPINSQNIPRSAQRGQQFDTLADELKAELRTLFIADDGWKIVGADLAAAEMRVAANLAQDQVLIDDLNRKVDTHSLLTILAYDLATQHDLVIDLDNPDLWVPFIREHYEFQRSSTKNATFATLYGGGLPAIAAQAKCDLQTAELIQNTIFDRYTGLGEWIDEVHHRIKHEGKLVTSYGRQRVFPYRTGVFDNKQLQDMLREGQNYLIQADASDYALESMTLFDERYHDRNWHVFNFVHDAFYALVPEGEAEDAKKLMIETIETARDWPAKMYADAKFGNNWGEL